MTKILALGGCGGMGRVAVRTLVEQGWCDHIIIADRNGELAGRLSKELGNRTSALCLDVNDRSALLEAMQGVNVVMNAVGPFFKYSLKILDAAISAGCHYVDICDDWEPTLEMLGLHEKAAASGITAILGLGATPGISNMLGVTAMKMLDKTMALYTCWDIEYAKPDVGAPRPSAATVHGIHQLTRPIPVLKDGRITMVEPMQRIDLKLHEKGILPAYTIGHPESVTFPKYFRDLQDCSNVFTISPAQLIALKIFAWTVRKRLLRKENAAYLVETIERLEKSHTIEDGWEKTREKVLSGKIPPPMFALAKGIKDGKHTTVFCSLLSAPAGGMGGATGVPLAIGAFWLAAGKLEMHGVFAPEAIIDPEMFFECLAPLCKPSAQHGAELLLTEYHLS